MKRRRLIKLKRTIPESHQPIASMEHGYLWIGGARGPCMVVIDKKRDLRALLLLLRREVK